MKSVFSDTSWHSLQAGQSRYHITKPAGFKTDSQLAFFSLYCSLLKVFLDREAF